MIVGGELRASQLDLSYDANAGVYAAPLQMQANNGILVIDDFGRQALTPEELLNRWIVPLDRGIDYLTLDNGLKFELPFHTKIVFSTNMEPANLADEAFFRRIRSKVLIPSIDDDAVRPDPPRGRRRRPVSPSAPGAAEHLRAVSREKGDGDLRPYLPAVVCELVSSISDYEDMDRLLDVAMVDRVAYLFFTQSDAMRAPAIPRAPRRRSRQLGGTARRPVRSGPPVDPVAVALHVGQQVSGVDPSSNSSAPEDLRAVRVATAEVGEGIDGARRPRRSPRRWAVALTPRGAGRRTPPAPPSEK